MSCSNSRRSWLLGLAGIGLAAALGGCGFHPLYGNHGDGQDTNTDLANVRIAPIANRTGQLLYNQLRDRLNPSGKPAEPVYVLEVVLVETGSDLLLEPNETASRTILDITAHYKLRDIKSGSTLLTSQSRSSLSYDVQTSQYATISSEQDVRQRATKQLSDDISTRVA
ncbi:MAG: LPS assembly lipoprotein LptE, partial [Bradyrhizobium sp.]